MGEQFQPRFDVAFGGFHFPAFPNVQLRTFYNSVAPRLICDALHLSAPWPLNPLVRSAQDASLFSYLDGVLTICVGMLFKVCDRDALKIGKPENETGVLHVRYFLVQAK